MVYSNIFCEAQYNETFKNVENQRSEINLRSIEYITKLFSNFAKYGYDCHKFLKQKKIFQKTEKLEKAF